MINRIVAALAVAWLMGAGPTLAARIDPLLGPVSDTAVGRFSNLVIVVDFPDVTPTVDLPDIERRAVRLNDAWYNEASHGRTRMSGTMVGPYRLSEPLERYKVSPYNFRVDSGRVYRLVAEALSLAEENGADLAAHDVVTVVARAFSMPGTGYGMMCYCANPGMLSKVGNGRARYDSITTRRGTVYAKGAVVMVENFHFGFLVHDLAHAIAGVHQGRRLSVDLYDFELQSRPRREFKPDDVSIHLGAWDVMSQHFIRRDGPPPGFSLFTRIRMGYVDAAQIALVKPGETRLVRLAPLARGGTRIGVKIPLDSARHLLVENRQRTGIDRTLPGDGMMIYRVDESLDEGRGMVRAMNADPATPGFTRAAFGIDGQAADAFIDTTSGVAVIGLVKLDTDYVVLVTTPDRIEAARELGRALRTTGPEIDWNRLETSIADGRIDEARELLSR